MNWGMTVWGILFCKVAHGYSGWHKYSKIKRPLYKRKKNSTKREILVEPDNLGSNMHINLTVKLEFLC